MSKKFDISDFGIKDGNDSPPTEKQPYPTSGPDPLEEARRAIETHRRQQEIQTMERIATALTESAPLLKDFSAKTDTLSVALDRTLKAINGGIHPAVGFSRKIAQGVSEVASDLTESFINERKAIGKDIEAERKRFIQEIRELHTHQLQTIQSVHRMNLLDIDRKDSRISLPPYIILICVFLLAVLSMFFGMILFAVLHDFSASEMSTLVWIFIFAIAICSAALIYVHFRE